MFKKFLEKIEVFWKVFSNVAWILTAPFWGMFILMTWFEVVHTALKED